MNNPINKLYRRKLLCDYLLNKDLLTNDINNNQLKIKFTKDENKDLVYSDMLLYNGDRLHFIYKLSNELKKCNKE
jgi:hypothetical protein